MAQTGSFIPKQSKTAAAPRRRSGRIYVFSYISYVLFFGTLLVVAGMFVYNLQLGQSLENQKAQLAQERESFSQSDIERVRELEQRLIVAKQLLNNHTSPSQVLRALESVTLENVQLGALSLERSVSGVYDLAVSGGAPTFNSLIFQRQVLAQNRLLKNASIANISYGGVEEDGGDSGGVTTLPITFELSQTLAISDFPYQFFSTSSDTELNENVETIPEETETEVLNQNQAGEPDALSADQVNE